MLNIRIVILSVVLVLILMLTVSLVAARTEVASDPANDPVSVLDNQESSANQNKASIPAYRSPLDECFDVPLRDAAGCRNASQTFSDQELRDVLNGRYEHRCCGLPR